MDRHIGHKPRSQYLQEIAEADLRKHNALTNDPVAAEIERVRELIETKGLGVVRAKLDELAMAATAGEFGERES